MKTKFLSDLAEIRFGINARTSDHGNIPCVQGKDFDDFGQLQTAGLSYISEDQCKDTDFLQRGDVLFAAKGSRNYAVVWNENLPRAVSSSTFFVLRNHTASVLPEYLAWFLMSARAERYFEQNVKLATVRTVSKKVLEQLHVDMVPLEKQNVISNLTKHFEKSLLLTKTINDKYSALVKQLKPKIIMKEQYSRINQAQIELVREAFAKYNELFNDAVYSEQPTTEGGAPEVVSKQVVLSDSLIPKILRFYSTNIQKLEKVRSDNSNPESLPEKIENVMVDVINEKDELLNRIQDL